MLQRSQRWQVQRWHVQRWQVQRWQVQRWQVQRWQVQRWQVQRWQVQPWQVQPWQVQPRQVLGEFSLSLAYARGTLPWQAGQGASSHRNGQYGDDTRGADDQPRLGARIDLASHRQRQLAGTVQKCANPVERVSSQFEFAFTMIVPIYLNPKFPSVSLLLNLLYVYTIRRCDTTFHRLTRC